jgi:hypothetical protein
MRLLTALILATFISQDSFAQNGEVKNLVEQHTNQMDIVFASKIILLVIIGALAIVTYVQWIKGVKKEEAEANTKS